MTPPPTIADRRPEVVTRRVPAWREGWTTAATSADHKVVAKLFMGTSLSFLAIAALAFVLTRIQLIVPDSTILRPDIFSQMSTLAMTSLTVLFAVPFVLGLLGYIVPLQIGARGVALPRLNQLAYWLYAIGTLVFFVSFLYLGSRDRALAAAAALGRRLLPVGTASTPGSAASPWRRSASSAGRSTWSRRSRTCARQAWRGAARRSSPGPPASSHTSSSSPGPAMVAALVMLAVDRHFDGVFFDAGEGGEPMLFIHLSWLYFTGIHAVMLVAALAVISEIIPTLSRKPLFSHGAVSWSLVAVGVLGTLAWMQNLYASPLAEGFAIFTMLVAVLLLVPIGLHLSSSGSLTMWEGAVSTRAPLVLAITRRRRARVRARRRARDLGRSAPASCSRTPSPPSRTRSSSSPVSCSRCSRRSTTGFRRSPAARSSEGPAKAAAGPDPRRRPLYGFAMFFAGLAGQPVDVFRYFEDDGVSTLNLIASIARSSSSSESSSSSVNLVRSYSGGRRSATTHGRARPSSGSPSPLRPLTTSTPSPTSAAREPLRDIREAIREREATYVPPEPLAPSAPPEVGVPDPGDEAGMSEEAAEHDAPTADPEDIVSGEAADDSDSDVDRTKRSSPPTSRSQRKVAAQPTSRTRERIPKTPTRAATTRPYPETDGIGPGARGRRDR